MSTRRTRCGRFFTTASNWSGANGIADRLVVHLWVSLLAVVAAAVIAIPLGIMVGDGDGASSPRPTVANLGRAIPSLAVLAFVVAAGWRDRVPAHVRRDVRPRRAPDVRELGHRRGRGRPRASSTPARGLGMRTPSSSAASRSRSRCRSSSRACGSR